MRRPHRPDEPTIRRPAFEAGDPGPKPYAHPEQTRPVPYGRQEPTVRAPHTPEPATWQPAAPGRGAEPATEYRFGPGVPTRVDTGNDRTVRVWHGTERPDQQQPGSPNRRSRRLLGGWLLPSLVLTGVLAYLGWQWHAPTLAVTGASVRTDPGGPPCDGTAVVTGTVTTNGDSGTVDYRWKRSDGTVSNLLHQEVAQGVRETDVVLRWTFDGRGTLRATATLEVLSPNPKTASVKFKYKCR